METDRLIIRRFEADDWRDLYDYLSKEEVLRYEPECISSEEDCKAKAEERSESEEFWAVILKENNKMIGHIYFAKEDPDKFQTWQLGYMFNPDYYRCGYATEAARRILKYGFEEMGAHRIIAMCNPENIASWKLLQRISMRREAHLIRNNFFHRDEKGDPIWLDTYLYAILYDDMISSSKIKR